MQILTISFSAFNKSEFSVKARLKNGGQADAKSCLPFYETETNWRTTLSKILEVDKFRLNNQRWEPQELAWMRQEGLLMSDNSGFSADYLKKIGERLYKSLFPTGNVSNLLQRSIANAEQYSNRQLHIQIEFNAETELNRLPDYPWEMVHDGDRFLADHNFTFSRYIAHLAAPPILSPVSPINVLLVSSGAFDKGSNPLSKEENEAVKKALQKSQQDGHIRLSETKRASFKELTTYLTENRGDDAPHVLHFDGHGAFGKRCLHDECRTFHSKLDLEQCAKCQSDLPSSQGYLLFEPDEDDDKEANYVSAEKLGSFLQDITHGDTKAQQGGVRLAVLSACKSAYTPRGNSVFNGVAQSLIWHDVPAVVAMQYTVSVKSATAFAERFYRELGNKQSLAVATSLGRRAMQTEHNQWYRLIFYLRWQDNEGGQLFAQKDQQNSQGTSSSTKKGNPPNNLNTHSSELDESNFVGREEILEDLKQALEQKNKVFITGRSGVGKSELARQYAQKYCGLYPGGIWYINALKKNILSDLEQGYQKILKQILKEDISAPDDEINKKLNFYYERWNDESSEDRVLIILDHFTEEDYKSLKAYLPDNEKFFKVLVITLDGQWTGIKSILIEVLKEIASIKFLSLHQKDEVNNNEQIAKQICDRVEHLPLVLEYVANSLMPTYDLNKIYQEINDRNIICEDEKINYIFELDWQHLNTETKVFSCLLSLASFAPIPVALEEALADKFDGSEWGNLSSKEMRKVLPILVKRYMIKKIPGNTHQFHSIVQYFLRYKLKELNKDRDILDFIENEFPELKQDVNVLIKKMEQLFCQVIAEEARKKILPNPTQNDLEEFKDFIPHIIRVITDMQPNLEDKDLVDLFTCLGRYYEGNGHYTEARNRYKDCLEIIKKKLGKQHPYIFKIQNAIAHIYLLSDNYKDAEPLYTKASNGGKRWLEENLDSSQYRETELNFARSKDYLGYLYLCLYLRDKFSNKNEAILSLNKVEPLLKEAEKLFAEEKPNAEYQDDIPRNLDHLAMFHRLQKQWKKAEEFYKKALEIREGQQKEHPILAESYHNSATNYFDLGIFYNSNPENKDHEKAKENYKKAEELYLKALEIKKKFYGEKNIKLAKTLDQLAQTYEELYEDDKAIEKYKEALDIRKTIWGKHLDVAENMKKLAYCYLYKENYEYSYEYAKDWFRQALDIMKSIEKSEDWERLIKEIRNELDELRKSDTDAESLFNRASNLLGSSLDSRDSV